MVGRIFEVEKFMEKKIENMNEEVKEVKLKEQDTVERMCN